MTLLSIIALTMISTVPARAQESVVFGEVFDSIAGLPLSDAAVFLWDTPYRTVSDAEGRFRIDHLPPGDYSVLFFHSRLGEMAASPGPVAVHVEAGDSALVELGTPSMFTLVSMQCLMEPRDSGTGIVAGRVVDGYSGMGLPGAGVTLSHTTSDGRGVSDLNVRSDGGGWYYTCEAPANVPLAATARFLDRRSERREVVVADGRSAEVSFLVSDLDDTDITGVLIDAETSLPVERAEVWLRGSHQRRLTDDEGRFHFDDVAPGAYMLMTEHLAYGTKMDTLHVPGGSNISVEMKLDTRPLEIAPLTVTVDARRMTERAMGGIQIPKAKVDEVRQISRDAADVLRSQHIPGVVIKRRSDGTMCVGYSSGQVRMLNNSSGGCVPMMIFINGAKASNSSLALQLPPDAIDRMVIYRPVEAGALFGIDAANGVLMIYTRGN